MKKNVFFKSCNFFVLVFILTSFSSIKATCVDPTLNCVSRDANNNVTYNWNNNGNVVGTVTLQYSLDGGTTWVSNSGSPVSPRIYNNVPNSSTVKYRVQIHGVNCSKFSNVLIGTISNCDSCKAPTLISVVRSSSNPLQVTYSWNNNGSNPGTVLLEYSIDGGETWIINAGSGVSPRTWSSIPNFNPIKYRIKSFITGCSTFISNVIDVNCVAPTLISAVRSSSNPLNVTVTWNNNGGIFGTLSIQYSIDGGTSWSSNSGSSISPRTINIPNSSISSNVIVRLNTNCNLISNSISVDNLFIGQSTQAVGSFFSNPKNFGCGDICVTFGNTNLSCYTDVSALNVGIGTQLYLLNTVTQLPVPANISNCILFGNSSSTSCNRIDTGIRWIRFVNGVQSVIWNVDPNTGIVTGSTLTCP